MIQQFHHSTSEYAFKVNETTVSKRYQHSLFTAVLFIIAKPQKQPKCPPTDEQRKYWIPDHIFIHMWYTTTQYLNKHCLNIYHDDFITVLDHRPNLNGQELFPAYFSHLLHCEVLRLASFFVFRDYKFFFPTLKSHNFCFVLFFIGTSHKWQFP